MRLPRPTRPKERDNTIALINIVFLMLIFFLIAGSLSPPLDPDVSLISTEQAERAEPPDALMAMRDGSLRLHGEETSASAYMALLLKGKGSRDAVVKLAADRELPAARLVEIVDELRAAGAVTVTVITERVAR